MADKAAARRRLLGMALASPVVLTLANRPAFASGAKCTLSAFHSFKLGDLSAHHTGKKKGAFESKECGDTSSCWASRSGTISDGVSMNDSVGSLFGFSGMSFGSPGVYIDTTASFAQAVTLGVAIRATIKVKNGSGFMLLDFEVPSTRPYIAEFASAYLNHAVYGDLYKDFNKVISKINGAIADANGKAGTETKNVSDDIAKTLKKIGDEFKDAYDEARGNNKISCT